MKNKVHHLKVHLSLSDLEWELLQSAANTGESYYSTATAEEKVARFLAFRAYDVVRSLRKGGVKCPA